MKSYPRFRGPSLILTALAHVLIFAAGLIAAGILRHGASYVTPFAPAEQIRAFLLQSPAAVRISNFFLFGSAVPFGIFAVTTVSCLRFMGIRAAGTNITLLGGLTATVAIFLSGISGSILSLPEVVASAPLVKSIDFFTFLCGGMFYSVGFGLMVAGISVTCYFTRLLPRWLVLLGMLLAITGELSWLSLLVFPANFFIPVTRYIGFVWIILAAVFLTRDRRSEHSASASPA